MLTIKEYSFPLDKPWCAIAIHDKWVPLAVFEREGFGVLAAQVNTEAPESREVIRCLEAGARLEEAAETGELAYLGVLEGRYVFLDIPPDDPTPRVGRLTPEALARGQEILRNENTSSR